MKLKKSRFLNLLFFACLQLLISCSQQSEGEISSIYVLYIRGHHMYYEGIECQQIKNDTILASSISDTTLTSKPLLAKINSEIFALKAYDSKNQTNGIGSRIRCEINYLNNEQQILCIGERIGMTLDGIKYKDNLNLAYLIKRNIGYYQYFTYEFLINFNELENSPRLDTVLNEMKVIRYLNTEPINDSIIDIIPF